MSIRRYANANQFTLGQRDLQTVPNGIAHPFDFTGVKVHKGLGLCCDDPKVLPCAYDVFAADVTNAVTAITFKDAAGVNKTVTFPSVSTVEGVATALATALISDGIDPFYNGDDLNGINIQSDKKRLRFISTVEIVSVTINSAVVSATKKCTSALELVYEFTFDVGADPGKISAVAGTNGTQIGTVGGFATGNAAGALSALNTALTTATFTSTRPATVTEANGEFTARVFVNKAVWYNAVELTRLATNQTWVA